MKIFAPYFRSFLTIFIVALAVIFFAQCIHPDKEQAPLTPTVSINQFAGSASCIQCHKSIYDTHLHTAHYLTTRIAEEKFINGSFNRDSNMFAYDTSHFVAMEKRDSGFYQVGYSNGIEKIARRMDIVIGSGTMGQSFLNWNKNFLFQLPVTYFSAAHQWSNSPGYPNKIIFNRPITSRCLECHTTFAKTLTDENATPEAFDRNQIIYGVDCEKCHGPAAEHVAYQTQHPTALKAKFIINPAHLTRQQNMDLCASCHGGRLTKTKPSFQFKAGDKLADFYEVDTTAPNTNSIDVHGNQYGLLRASKCYRMSDTMTCNTCHNTHENEKGKTTLFSQRCITCHTVEHGNFCTLKTASGINLKSNCIDCHMPLSPSRAIAVFLTGKAEPTAALIRSHYISIYPEETKRVLNYIKK
jgi:hypothetical protein